MTIPRFKTLGKSSGFSALFSNGSTTEMPSKEKIAVPKNSANFSKLWTFGKASGSSTGFCRFGTKYEKIIATETAVKTLARAEKGAR